MQMNHSAWHLVQLSWVGFDIPLSTSEVVSQTIFPTNHLAGTDKVTQNYIQEQHETPHELITYAQGKVNELRPCLGTFGQTTDWVSSTKATYLHDLYIVLCYKKCTGEFHSFFKYQKWCPSTISRWNSLKKKHNFIDFCWCYLPQRRHRLGSGQSHRQRKQQSGQMDQGGDTYQEGARQVEGSYQLSHVYNNLSAPKLSGERRLDRPFRQRLHSRPKRQQ